MMWQSGSEGRAVIKNIRFTIFGLRQRFLENLFIIPEIQHLMLGIDK